MNRVKFSGLVLLLALLSGACQKSPPSADQVSAVAAIAKELRSNPDNADKILSAHGLTRSTFDSLMYEIARDPAHSREFRAAAP